MGYSPVTPFRRLVDAAHLQHQRHGIASADSRSVNKWQALRTLAAIRESLGLSDRDLGVLEALISFHQGNDLDPATGGLVVFPSNAAICERLNGMPCSTMRRHIARLVASGILLRRDSPNGKRYRRREAAFGFDLMPLVTRFAEFSAAAEEHRIKAAQLHDLRETVSLMRRDLVALITYGRSQHPEINWDQYSDLAALSGQALRRRLQADDLRGLQARFEAALSAVSALLEPAETSDPSIKDSRNEQHHHNSDKEIYDSENCDEDAVMVEHAAPQDDGPGDADARKTAIPFGLVLSACREVQAYITAPLRNWPDLLRAADHIRPMMGIPPDVWDKAKTVIGAEHSAVTLMVMLERFAQIRSPGAYLRSLVQRAQVKSFSALPMLMAASRQAA